MAVVQIDHLTGLFDLEQLRTFSLVCPNYIYQRRIIINRMMILFNYSDLRIDKFLIFFQIEDERTHHRYMSDMSNKLYKLYWIYVIFGQKYQ